MSSDPADELPMPLIVYVEDEVLVQEMVVAALVEAGFRTLVATSGQQAVKLLRENRELIRGLVTDINLLDDMDGWELARTAREQAGDLPVVYVSGASGHEWSSRGVPSSLMITKPFAAAQIVVAISSLLVASCTTP